MTKGSTYTTIDIETTTRTTFKRKANPFDPTNWMVLVGYKRNHESVGTGVRLTKETQDHDWLAHVLSTPDLEYLVGHNIKFDLLHALRNPLAYVKWQEFVERGGMVWDTQLAEYLLQGQAQSSHMMSLNEVSLIYGGDTKIDEVKALWEAGVPTEDIDPDLLYRYLCGETLPNGERRGGDLDNTELVFLAQKDRAVTSGQLRSIQLNMGALCATIEMERNGMYVNEELGKTLAAELAEKLDSARTRLDSYLPPDLRFNFSWTNRYHLSPMIFGGKVKYERRQYGLKDGRNTWFSPTDKPQAAHLFMYAQKKELQWVLTDGTTTNVDPSNLTDLMVLDSYVTYKGGKNAGEYKTKQVSVDDTDKPKSRMADCFQEFAGHTTADESWASSTEGLYSVAAEVIEALGNRDIPFLKDLSSVVKMTKDLGTYYITWNEKDQCYVGMLTLVQDGGIIHHSLNHTSTVTGRFSSSNPNLQNIPKGNKSDVKKVFESRFDDGCIIQSDFSSLEVYIQAILTNCQSLLTDLRNGIDLHCMRLSLKEHMEYAEVFALCKGENAQPEWDYKRTGAKEFSFQRAYGAGNKAIALTTGMPIAEVEALSKAEDERYPEIGVYTSARIEEIKDNRKPTATMVPHPCNQAVMVQLGISRVSTPDGKRYTYRESPSLDYQFKRGVLAGFMPTEVKNYEFQGTGGEWMKAAMWLSVRAFYLVNNFDNRALLVNTVHDALYADADSTVRLRVGAILQGAMEAASDFMEWWFDWPLPIAVPTDTVYGVNMGDETPFTKGEGADEFRKLAGEYRDRLRMIYMDGYTPSYLQEKA